MKEVTFDLAIGSVTAHVQNNFEIFSAKWKQVLDLKATTNRIESSLDCPPALWSVFESQL